jgi:hypothetical protein
MGRYDSYGFAKEISILFCNVVVSYRRLQNKIYGGMPNKLFKLDLVVPNN